MRKFYFNEIEENNTDSRIVTLTEEEVLNEYFEYWSKKMRESGKKDLISKENCLEDWKVVNWAWENKEGIK